MRSFAFCAPFNPQAKSKLAIVEWISTLSIYSNLRTHVWLVYDEMKGEFVWY